MTFRGIFCEMATPFDYRGDLYIAKLQHNVARWNQTRLTGYLAGWRAGEGPLLPLDEKARLWDVAGETAEPGRTLLAGVSADGVREAIRQVNRAAEAGWHAAVVEQRTYYPECASPAAAKLFFRAVADAARIPVVAAAPGGGEREPEWLYELSAHPNIAAAVLPACNAERLQAAVKAAGPGFPLLAASSPSELPEALQQGAAAAVLPFAGAAPFFCLSIEEAVRTRALDEASELAGRARRAAEALQTHGIAGLKYAMDLRGYYGGPVRAPLPAISEAARREIEEALREIRS